MPKDAVASDDMAKKFATEKETPYTRWVRAEGLEIVSSFYVPDLHSVELRPWPRRGALREAGDRANPRDEPRAGNALQREPAGPGTGPDSRCEGVAAERVAVHGEVRPPREPAVS